MITTRGAPGLIWKCMAAAGGWILALTRLLQACAAPVSAKRRRTLAPYGRRGQTYVQRYDWDDIARQTIGVYRWVLGRGHQPDCVRTD